MKSTLEGKPGSQYDGERERPRGFLGQYDPPWNLPYSELERERNTRPHTRNQPVHLQFHQGYRAFPSHNFHGR